MTLKQLFQQFGHDPHWSRFAAASASPMVSVFIRKLGDRDISTLNDFDLSLQLAMSEQVQERKVKAKACMRHLLRWAEEHGHTDIPSLPDDTEIMGTGTMIEAKAEIRVPVPVIPVAPKERKKPAKKSAPKPKAVAKSAPKPKKTPKSATPKPKPDPKPKPAPKPKKGTSDAPKPSPKPKKGTPDVPKPAPNTIGQRKRNLIRDIENERKELEQAGIPLNGWPTAGSVYYDGASKGRAGNRQRRQDRWIGEFMSGGVHFRVRSKERKDCEDWVKAVRMGLIKPWHNGPDWYREVQRKSVEVRYGEMITSAAEEACLLLQYHDSRELQPIADYMQQRLMPHMTYYCVHTLGFGCKTAIEAVRQCVGILLTDIHAGKPVTNFTRQAKRMLRIRKAHRDFWYYEQAPKDVRLVIDGLDFAPLADIYRIVKDKRL